MGIQISSFFIVPFFERPCKNHLVCGNVLEEIYNDFYMDCIILFGEKKKDDDDEDGLILPFNNKSKSSKLEISKTEKDFVCPICISEGIEEVGEFVVEMLNCKHKLCVECFRNIFFNEREESDEEDEKEPKFPFPEIEEYFFNEDIETKILENRGNIPKDVKLTAYEWFIIQIWEEVWSDWNQDKINKIKTLTKCCMCRM